MTTKPKKREAKEAPKSTQKAKQFSRKSKFKGEGERRYALARQVNQEAKALQDEVSKEQEKAKEQSLWSSIGGALGGLALGVATGGLGWAAQGAAVGIGSYVGGRGGKAASEKKDLLGIGKRLGGKGEIDSNLKHRKYDDEGKEIPGARRDFLFYDKTAEAQKSAFTDFEKTLNKGIAQKSLMAGIFAGAMAGGAEALGDYYTKAKDARAVKKAASAASTTTATATPVATTTEYAGHIEDTLSAGADLGFDMSSLKLTQPTNIVTPGLTPDLSTLITPETTKAAPTLFAGLGESMKKYALYSGGAAIANWRPEMKKLKPMMTTSSNKQYG